MKMAVYFSFSELHERVHLSGGRQIIGHILTARIEQSVSLPVEEWTVAHVEATADHSRLHVTL